MADVNSTLLEVCNEIALALQVKLNTDNKFKPINYAARVLDIGSEANATASDVKLGKKVYVGDDYVDGTFTGEDVTIQNDDVGIIQVELTPEDGKYYQKVIIPAQPGLIAANIRKGVTIFGITGTLEEQTVLPKLATPVIELAEPEQSGFTLKVSNISGNSEGTMVVDVTDDSGTSSNTYKWFDPQESAISFTGNAATVLIKLTSSAQRTDLMVKKNNTSVYTLTTSSGQTSIDVVNGDVIEVIQNSTCFPAGTPVLMADGSQKLIETIEVGDKVKSFDLDTYEYGEAEVTEVVTGYTNRMAMLLLSDNSYIAMAEGHPLYTIEGWKSINKEGYPVLRIGDQVLGANGYAEILDMQVVDCEPTMVYSLSISSETGALLCRELGCSYDSHGRSGLDSSTSQETDNLSSKLTTHECRLVYFAGNGVTSMAVPVHGAGGIY